MSRRVHRVVAGAVVAHLALHALESRASGHGDHWQRTNYRGRPVSLLAGPALTVAVATTGPGLAGAVAGVGAGLAGGYDDHAGDASARGFRGHLRALRTGELTSGGVKLVGISFASLLAATCLRPRRDVWLTGAVIAGTANLVNLLDLRPGRALKVGIVAGALVGEPGVVGTCASLLPGELRERRMLGDAGANALGAVLGVAVVRRLRTRVARRLVLAALVALTAASERVSFSDVIARTSTLRRLDELGRLP